MWGVREGDGRGDVSSPGGDQGTCTVPGKAWNLCTWSVWPGPLHPHPHTDCISPVPFPEETKWSGAVSQVTLSSGALRDKLHC